MTTLRDDIIEVDQSFDATKIINKLTVIGMGPGGTHLNVTVDDEESQAKYGVMEGLFSAKGINDIDTLTSFANATLKTTKEAKHRMTIKLIGTDQTYIELGDIFHVEHPDSGIDGNYRIISLERVSGVAGDFTKLEMAAPEFRVAQKFMDMERRADALDYHPQGAPSIIPQHEADNVDATHSLKMKFYIPEEAVDMGKLQIKEAKVALTLEAFRAYSTGAAAGGGQTTSSGGGQTTSDGGGQTSSGGAAHTHDISGQTAESAGTHRHKMFHFDVPCGDYATNRRYMCSPDEAGSDTVWVEFHTNAAASLWSYQSGGAHTHGITGTTSSSESSHTHTVSDHTHTVSDHTHSVTNHTHGIVYGIYESTPPSDVYIKLNGVQIAGPFNADEYVDITIEFLNRITTYGWNTLEFTSSQLGRIGATLFMRLFLQAS